jgi:hypothetical protein
MVIEAIIEDIGLEQLLHTLSSCCYSLLVCASSVDMVIEAVVGYMSLKQLPHTLCLLLFLTCVCRQCGHGDRGSN